MLLLKIRDLYIFASTFILCCGFWKIIFIKVFTKAYKLFAKPNETYFTYLCRELDSPIWKLKKRLKLSWLYDTPFGRNLQRLLGIVLVLIGCALFIVYFLIRSTQFGIYFDIKL